MIRLYSDRRFLKAGARPAVMLYPFWGKPDEDPAAPLTGRFDRYMELGPSLFTMTSLEEADLAIVPAPWEDLTRDADARQLAHDFMRQANRHGKRLALFCINDVSDPIPCDDALIFRTSFYRSRRLPLELAQPAWIEDFVEKYRQSEVPLRPKRPIPSVGFCGYAGPTGPARVNSTLQLPLKLRLRRVATDVIDTLGLRTIRAARGKALNVLQRSRLVDAQFIMRNVCARPGQLLDSTVRNARLRPNTDLRRHGLPATVSLQHRLEPVRHLGERARHRTYRSDRRGVSRGIVARRVRRATTPLPRVVDDDAVARGLLRELSPPP